MPPTDNTTASLMPPTEPTNPELPQVPTTAPQSPLPVTPPVAPVTSTAVVSPVAPVLSADAQREKHIQLVAHLTNQVRIKKSAITDSENKMGQLEREYTHMEGQLHHIDQDVRRVQGEFVHRESAGTKQEGASKAAQIGIRDKDMELKKGAEGTAKLEHDINRLKLEIANKERRVGELKEESRSSAKSKEDLRRKIELELSTIKTKTTQAREKQVQIQRFRMDLERKKSEIIHKKNAPTDRFHSVGDNQREIVRMESDLLRIEQDIHRHEGELHLIESNEHKGEGDAQVDQGEMRAKELILHRTSDEVVKLGREVDKLKVEIGVRERDIFELRGESQEVRKAKEDLRRQYELEHFSANSEFTQAKEKGIQLVRFQQEFIRKEAEMEKNKKIQAELRHDLMFLEQDVATLEAELRHATGKS